jgi:hypothetical protein
MSEAYPFCELEVFVAGYERGPRHAESKPRERSHEEWVAQELSSRQLTLYDLTREGLLMLGMRAEFVPREIFDAGVLRALNETTQ